MYNVFSLKYSGFCVLFYLNVLRCSDVNDWQQSLSLWHCQYSERWLLWTPLAWSHFLPMRLLGIKQGERERGGGRRERESDGDHVVGWIWMRQAPCDWLSTGLSSFLYGNRRNQAIGFAPAIMPMNAEWNGGSPLWPQWLTRHLALLRTHTPPFIAGLRLKLVTSWGFTHRTHIQNSTCLVLSNGWDSQCCPQLVKISSRERQLCAAWL